LEEFDFDHARGLKRDLIAHLGTLGQGSGKDRYQIYDAEAHDDMIVRSALHADLCRP